MVEVRTSLAVGEFSVNLSRQTRISPGVMLFCILLLLMLVRVGKAVVPL